VTGTLANDRHERFCEEYLVDLNATAAYLRAYPGTGHASARRSASDLLTNPDVTDRIAELQDERAARVQVRLDDVLRELMLLAFSDVRHFEVDDLGHLNLRDGAPESAWRAVSSVKHRIISNGDFTTREIEYRLWNKNDALKQLRDHLGEHAGQDEDVIPLATLRKALARARLRSA
jgi:phage terminase small subunit